MRRLGTAVVALSLPCLAPAAWRLDRLAAADALCQQQGRAAWLVLHQGAEVHRWGDVARPLPCHSVRKSVLSMPFGMAQARGQVDLQATLGALGALGIDDKQRLTEQEKTATVQHLLQDFRREQHHWRQPLGLAALTPLLQHVFDPLPA